MAHLGQALLTLVLALRAQGQADPDAPPRTQGFTYVVPLGQRGGGTSEATLGEASHEAWHLLKSSAWLTVKGGFVASRRPDGTIVLLSSSLPEIQRLKRAADALAAMPRLPDGVVQTLGAFGSGLEGLVRDELNHRQPLNAREDAPLSADTQIVLQPYNHVVLASGDRTVTVNLRDVRALGETVAIRRSLYSKLDAHAAPQTARSEDEIRAAMERFAAREEKTPRNGFQIVFGTRGEPAPTDAAAGETAVKAYREYVDGLRQSIDARFKTIQDELGRRYPGLFPGAAGQSFGALPAEFRDALRAQILANPRPGLDSEEAVDAFLAGATVSEATPGIEIGISTAPDFNLLGFPFWPR